MLQCLKSCSSFPEAAANLHHLSTQQRRWFGARKAAQQSKSAHHRTPRIPRYHGLQKAALHLSGCLTHTRVHQMWLYPCHPPQCRGQSGSPGLAEVCCCPFVTICALQRMSCASSPQAQAFLDSLSQRALAVENFLRFKLTFFSPSHLLHGLKGNIFSYLIYSYCITNSVYCSDPAGKGCPSLGQVAAIPGSSAHFTAGTDTLLLSEILHYIKLSPSIISPLCAAESSRYFGRLSQMVTPAVTSLNTSHSYEHWTQ